MRVVNFFSHTPSLSVTYFFTVLDWFISFEMLKYAQKYEKGSFFLFYVILAKIAQKWQIFQFSVVNFCFFIIICFFLHLNINLSSFWT